MDFTMQEQYSPSTPERQGTDFHDGDQLDVHVQSDHVVSYEQGVARRLAAEQTETREIRRPLEPHEQIDEITGLLATYRDLEIAESQRRQRSQGNPDDYELINE